MAIHRIRLWFLRWCGRNRATVAGGVCGLVVLVVLFTVRSWEHEGGRGGGRGFQEPSFKSLDPPLVGLTLVRSAMAKGARKLSHLCTGCDFSSSFRNFILKHLHCPNSAKIKVCLDGSLPGYHLLRGEGSGSDKWLLHIEVLIKFRSHRFIVEFGQDLSEYETCIGGMVTDSLAVVCSKISHDLF